MGTTIGYLGPSGTFCEEAAQQVGASLQGGDLAVAEYADGDIAHADSIHAGNTHTECTRAGGTRADSAYAAGTTSGSSERGQCIEFRPYRSIPVLIAAVDSHEVDYGVVPAENSYEGSVSSTWDVLLHNASASICQEVLVSVRHHLLAQRGTKLSSIGTVLSHPQALAQCREFIAKKLPNAKLYETTSTAEAARIVSVNALPLAAIGSESCASLYSLDIIAADIQDQRDNVTRFLVLSNSEERARFLSRGGVGHKTSIVCAIERDRPGSLHGLLGVFAERNINLTRIESRPSRKGYGDYVFFIDLEGRATDAVISEALGSLHDRVISLKVLGSYRC